jgi:uncharacterized Zn finger protein
VAGYDLYRVEIEIRALAEARRKGVRRACAGRIGSLVSLLAGELGDDVLAVLTDARHGLFPEPDEIAMRCSCPDWAGMCKHVAATLYGVGLRLDDRPELFFTLRDFDQAELIAAAATADIVPARRGAKGRRRIAPAALEKVFGVELELELPAGSARRRRRKAR